MAIMNKKRSSDIIITQILEICIEGASKTGIVYRSYLNFKTVGPYLRLLIKNGFIETVWDNRTLYKTTDKGIELMNRFKHHQNEIYKLRAAMEHAD
jgi:predicted transcriptional regulator